MRVPFSDLSAQFASIETEVMSAMKAVIHDSAFIGGKYVQAFEQEFASYCGAKHAIGISNGTDAVRLGLLACGVGPGDEVITVPQTFIATTEAISMTGATFRFVDIEPNTATMDPEALRKAISKKTKAIVPVHLYGQTADMRAIMSIAREHGLKVVADAAQAHGATFDGQPVGAVGDAVSYSFYPGKNLGAFGDAGALTTNDAEIAHRVSLLRDHGRKSKYEHLAEGFNCRLDGLQAAILSVKLRHLEDWTERRRKAAASYRSMLADVHGIELPGERAGSRHVYHLFVTRTTKRDALLKHLLANGVVGGVHYPIPLHRQPAYARLGLGEGSFPVAERQSRECLSLPLFAEMSTDQVRIVVDEIKRGLARID